MSLTVYLVGIAVLLVGITGIVEIKERKKEKVRLEEIKKRSTRTNWSQY